MPQTGMAMCANKINFCTTISYKPKIALGKRIIDNTISSYLRKKNRTKENIFFEFLFQVQKIPNFAYQIYQTLQIYLVYEKDDIKYKYDRKWKTENVAEKHNFQV